MMRINSFIIAIVLLSTSFSVFSQSYAPPLRIPPSLSANFGELRNNHFHSGLDYRTQQAVNKPVFAVADGYISRINVSPSGYGLALYIDHPDGNTSVYGHLNSYSSKIANYIRAKQYENESYLIDIYLKNNEIPVKKGEQVALSGNTGGSGGPHLHFEMRDSKTQDPMDPFDFVGKTMIDTQKPDLRGIAFYPAEGKGAINGGNIPVYLNIGKSKSGGYLELGNAVNGWGKIGVGVKAIDRMNGASHVFGVKKIRLYVDGVIIFSSHIARFPFDKARMFNSFIDFEEWRNNKSFYMKSFVDSGNTLPIYETRRGDGYINITAEREYKMRYELEDHYGNTLVYSFTITGKKQTVPSPPRCDNLMAWNISNWYFGDDFTLTIPSGNLYANFCYKHGKTPSAKYFSNVHQVNYKPVPLHKSGVVWIKLLKQLPNDTTRYGIIEIDKKGKENWMGGRYKNGGVEVAIRELGSRYAIDIDTINPVITPINLSAWVQQKKIIISVKDEKSGVANWRGEIDGRFAIFAHDMKSNQYIYEFDDSRLVKGQTHQLFFTATDGAGNKSDYKFEFMY